jgi:hypothetical protein
MHMRMQIAAVTQLDGSVIARIFSENRTEPVITSRPCESDIKAMIDAVDQLRSTLSAMDIAIGTRKAFQKRFKTDLVGHRSIDIGSHTTIIGERV